MIYDKRFFFYYPLGNPPTGGSGSINDVVATEISPKIIENWECHYNLFTSPSTATLTLRASIPGEKVDLVSGRPRTISGELWAKMKPYLFHRKIIHTMVKNLNEWRFQPYFLSVWSDIFPIVPLLELNVYQRIPPDAPIPSELIPYLLYEPPVREGGESIYYYPCWKGYVDNVTTGFSGGAYTHSIALQDTLMWYSLSRVNIRPSMIADWAANEFFWASTKEAHTMFSTNLASLSLSEVLRAILGFKGAGGEDDPLIVGVNEFLIDIAGQSASWFIKDISQLFQAAFEQFTTSGKRKKWFLHGDCAWSQNILRIDSEILSDPFQKIIPYSIAKGNEDIWQHDFKTRLEILNELKEALSLEIFMDTTTELVVKVPSYNETISLKSGQEPVLDFYLRNLENTKVISQNISEVPSEAVNFLIFTGESFSREIAIQKDKYLGQLSRVNANSIQRYLVRAESASSSLTIDEDAIEAYAKFLMEKMNTDVFQGSVTIVSRPGIRLGRNILWRFGHLRMLGYVVSIDEAWQPGAQPQMTLGVQAVRDNESEPLYSAFPYSDFTKTYSVRRHPVADGGMLQDILPLFYTNPTNESVRKSVVEDNRENFKTKHQLLSVSEALVKDIKDLFKDGISSVLLKGVDK